VFAGVVYLKWFFSMFGTELLESDSLWTDVIGSSLLFLCCALSATAGVGGGILNVGLFLLVWEFAYIDAVTLSLATLLGNYFAQVSGTDCGYITWTYLLTLLRFLYSAVFGEYLAAPPKGKHEAAHLL
jgi:uncharacterized membrane protein YfcA